MSRNHKKQPPRPSAPRKERKERRGLPFKPGFFARILIPVAFVAIVIYLIFAAWAGIRDPYTFVLAYEGSVENGLRASGWIVREETPIHGGNGIVQLNLTEGEKIGMGQAIATIHQSEEYKQNQKDMNQTRADLTALQFAAYDGSPKGVALEDQLLASMKAMRVAGSSGSCGDLVGKSDGFRKLVLRREYLVSSNAVEEMTKAAEGLYTRLESIQSSQGESSVIQAQSAGIFSTNLDGYETLLTPDSITGIMPEDINRFSGLIPQADDDCLGKLITSWRWYYAVTVSAEEATQFATGDKVYIQFDSLSASLPMTVFRVSENQNDRAVVVFRSAEDLDQIRNLRQESCQIVFRSEEGIVVPKEALRVEEDGQTVVYTVSGYLASMKPVKVLTENENSYLVEASSSDGTEILRSGDEVILASAELYDGKVVR